jgi:uncharacterized protein (DUF58 family)
MEETYTYTARNALDPSEVVTFTLHDHRLSVDPGVALEHVEQALETLGDEEEADREEGGGYQPTWIKPTAVSLLEKRLSPFHVGDLDASLKDETLRVIAWMRSGGLLLAPVIFAVEQVDNPDAAEAFVKELKHRKQAVEQSGRLPGLMDYWAGWMLVGLFVMALMLWSKIRDGSEEA